MAKLKQRTLKINRKQAAAVFSMVLDAVGTPERWQWPDCCLEWRGLRTHRQESKRGSLRTNTLSDKVGMVSANTLKAKFRAFQEECGPKLGFLLLLSEGFSSFTTPIPNLLSWIYLSPSICPPSVCGVSSIYLPTHLSLYSMKWDEIIYKIMHTRLF